MGTYSPTNLLTYSPILELNVFGSNAHGCRRAERNATYDLFAMSSSQPLTNSEMFGFCKLAAAWWVICWSLYRLWFVSRDQTRSGPQPAFWRVVGPGFASSIRLGPRLSASFALAAWHGGGRRRDGPANWPRWGTRPEFVSCSRHSGVLPRLRQAAARAPWPEPALDLTILKRLRRVAV